MAPTTAPKPGLRERKKIQTRQAIRHAAYRLFADQGYDGTTVEQIAAAADVSASTVFRYFPTKEDIVLSDEYDPLMEAALRARPAGEPFVESIRQAVVGLIREMYATERLDLLARMRLVRDVPAIRARMGENMQLSCGMVARALAERDGGSGNEFELRVVASALLAAWSEAIMAWAEAEGREDLGDVLDRTLRLLSANFSA
ncbi:TetR/AcrR family transcriptional regulator [Streptomyces sp. NBC_01537]|uniref:TetR/AcrR family transcriptional regulator n=1 Tax=Streptomyces sp. NBC_01537 TaxID=2903896 RepID=UPI00386D9E6E